MNRLLSMTTTRRGRRLPALFAALIPATGLLLSNTAPAAAQSAKNREEKAQTQPAKEEHRHDTTVYSDPVIVYPSPSPRIPSPSPAPTFRARAVAPRIAFTSDRDGDPELYIMWENGTAQQRLTRRAGPDFGAAFSPWRGRIAYIAAPEGKAGGIISLMNADGKKSSRLMPNEAREATYVTWSSDDNMLAFVTERDGNPEIYVMDAAGRNVRRLTNHPARDTEPVFSADGAFVYFVSDRDGKPALYRMHADGSGEVTRMTPPDLGPIAEPTYSSLGAHVAFTVVAPESPDRSDIYIMDANGKGLRPLTMNTGKNRQPVFSPEGDRIAFSSNRSGKFAIYTLNIVTNNTTQLTFGPGNDTYPTWW